VVTHRVSRLSSSRFMTYPEMARAFGISHEQACQYALRKLWPRHTDARGRQRVAVPDSELQPLAAHPVSDFHVLSVMAQHVLSLEKRQEEIAAEIAVLHALMAAEGDV
jgi:hypothetical protein